MPVAVRPVPRLTEDRAAISPELLPLVAVLSIPSWPELFEPQHLRETLSIRAQFWIADDEMAVTEDADEEEDEEDEEEDEEDEEEPLSVVNPVEVSYWLLIVLPAESLTPVVTLVL